MTNVHWVHFVSGSEMTQDAPWQAFLSGTVLLGCGALAASLCCLWELSLCTFWPVILLSPSRSLRISAFLTEWNKNHDLHMYLTFKGAGSTCPSHLSFTPISSPYWGERTLPPLNVAFGVLVIFSWLFLKNERLGKSFWPPLNCLKGSY